MTVSVSVKKIVFTQKKRRLFMQKEQSKHSVRVGLSKRLEQDKKGFEASKKHGKKIVCPGVGADFFLFNRKIYIGV